MQKEHALIPIDLPANDRFQNDDAKCDGVIFSCKIYVWITTFLKPLNSFPTEIETDIAIL